jgi:uncharacterized damage-inducible protein DinB
MNTFTLQNLAAYNQWANQRVQQTLENLGDEVPAVSLHLWSHLLNAQVVWLSRIEHLESPVGVFDEHTLAECREMHESTVEQLIALAASSPENLAETITYTNTKGEAFENSLHDILMQVLNHSTYHRAQIAINLRQSGFTPVNTDYITFVREMQQQQRI